MVKLATHQRWPASNSVEPYGKLPVPNQFVSRHQHEREDYKPTFEEASVRLFRVVLLPDEGLPTNPINGSRGIL